MRRIYAVSLRPEPHDRWFPTARALLRYTASRRYGGWPDDDSLNPTSGAWAPVPAVSFRWQTVSDGDATGYRFTTVEPFDDPTLRLQTTTTVVDGADGPVIDVEAFASSTSSVLTGTVAYENTAPPVVAALVDKLTLRDGSRPVSTGVVDRTGRAVGIVDWLEDPTRGLPVLVVVDPGVLGGVGVDVLARQVAGLAHVVVCDRATARELADLGVEVDDSTQVGLFWVGYRRGDRSRVTTWALRHCQASVDGTPAWPAVRTLFSTAALRLERQPTFEDLERADLRQRLATARHADAAEAELASLLAAWEQDLSTLDRVTEDRDLLAVTVDELTDQLDEALELFDVAVDAAGSRAPVDDRTEPVELRTPGDAVDAAAEAATHLIFLPDAYRSAEASAFSRPEVLYQDLLAADTVARRWAEDDLEAGGLSATAFSHGLVWRSGISQTAAGRYAADYTVTIDGEPVLLGPHFGRGAHSSNHYRAYLHLDRTTRQAYVGHVGVHLRDASNR